jgi:NADH-quinone oxidoreductase subunit A
MLEAYFPIFVFIIVGALFAIALPLLGYIRSPKKPDPAKLSPYECGFPAKKDARFPFDVRYYLVAILFILFDLETAFLVPWAVSFRVIGWFGFIAMGFFLLFLLVGFIYEWRKGALEWE